ncbi:KH domain-containing protein At4g18375-like [Pyrus communis]|uniref:KH domain-containing protein At4g18375-like n=1 Tax=Pyrus communis TaxID=23211 RepID=UPI0035C13269
MGETGKRYRSQRDHDGGNKNQKRRFNDRDEKGSDDLVVYRILCPDGVIGSVIGKSGKVINSIRQDTRAKIKVVDPFPGAKERVITIYSYVKDKEEVEVDDEFNDMEPLCAAQDALLRVHSAISNALASVGDSDKRRRDSREDCQILVPSSQSANIIGKAGSTIKKLRSKTRTNIKIVAKDATDPTHSCAMDFDNFLMINGESEAVKKALFAVSAIMYKFAPKEEISLETSVPEALPSIIIPSDVPIYQSGGLYQSGDPIVSSRAVPPIIGATSLQDLQGYTDKGNTWPMYSSALPLVSGFGVASRSEELIVRVLCPFDKIGRVIGKGGGTIKSIRQVSGARIEVDDTKDRDECIISVTATESPDDLKSMAVEAVLLLQEKINDEDDDSVSIRLLVPSKFIGCIIGKSGSIINEIRKRTKADIRISKADKPRGADANELVEVAGDPSSLRDALIQIVLRLRDDVLKDRDDGLNTSGGAESMYSGGPALSMPSVLPSVPPVSSMRYDQRAESGSGLGLLSSGSLYGYGSVSMGENGYGSMSSYSSKLYGGSALPPPSTLEMLVPANALGKVMGKGGANIANIRKISGAMVEISESKSSRGDRVAHISGTPEQKRTAENLIQAFIMAP